jgi:hypothetical protein
MEAAESTASYLLELWPQVDLNDKAAVIEKCRELPNVRDPETGDILCASVDLHWRSGCAYAWENVRDAAEFQRRFPDPFAPPGRILKVLQEREQAPPRAVAINKTWSAERNEQGEWTFVPIATQADRLNRYGRGMIVHGFNSEQEARQWANEWKGAHEVPL